MSDEERERQQERYLSEPYADTDLLSARYGHCVGHFSNGTIFDAGGQTVGSCTHCEVFNNDGFMVGFWLHHRLASYDGTIVGYLGSDIIYAFDKKTALFRFTGDTRAAAAIAVLVLVADLEGLHSTPGS